MSLMSPTKAIGRVSQASDPKKAILDSVESKLDDVHPMGDMVLVGTYIRPERTAGGIIRPHENVSEDVWQGKVGLVLKLGPDAFVDTGDYHFNSQRADKGEWVVYKGGDAWQLMVNGYPCRLVRDVNIKIKVDDPSVVF